MSKATKSDQLVIGLAVGTAIFGVLNRRTRAEKAGARIGGGAMLATSLFGNVTSKKTFTAVSLLYIFAPEIASLNSPDSIDGLGGLGDARHQLYTMPRRWWIPDASKGEKNCHTSKVEALMRFARYNSRVIDNYNGISHEESPAEFDSINAKHGLSGNRAVVNIAQALWVSMPPGRPFCLTDMDIDTLNETSPAKEDPLGVGFMIPDYAIADKQNREQMEIFKREEAERRESPPVVRVQSSQSEVPF